MKKKPVRLAKKKEGRPLIDENNMILGIPAEFVLITIIMASFFILIMIFMGPCTESGLWFNAPHA